MPSQKPSLKNTMIPLKVKAPLAVILVAAAFWIASTDKKVESEISKPLDTSTAPQRPTAVVHYCSDGDTCRLSLSDGGVWFNARLFGIDAPETEKKRKKQESQPFGDAAREFLNQQIKDKTVEIEQADLDNYNRPVVEIFLHQKSVNVMLVEQGLAEAYRGRTKRIDKAKFFAAEDSAKAAKKGIWSQKEYLSPADFRKAQKDK